MLYRAEHHMQGNCTDKFLSLHAKFNDALNDAVAGNKQHMMTITFCNTLHHFDRWGKLSEKASELTSMKWMNLPRGLISRRLNSCQT